MNHQKYSVVIPVFNSQKSLEELYFRIRSTFKKYELEFEVIFVDDGSEDESWEILKKLKPGRKQISMSRYEDQVTVIINELDVIY